MVDAVRTADERFETLPGYAFAPHYTELPGFDGLRVHRIDEGPRDAPVALCLHGQPTWSYLYRKFTPALLRHGMRVVAPDLFGFGRSDKPTDQAWYSFDRHRTMLLGFIEALDLRNITLVCQDWGGLLGLTLPMEMPNRFARLLVMNTGFGTGEGLTEGFLAWRAYNRSQFDLDIAALMQRATPGLTEAEAQAYAAPFPDARYKAGVRAFPDLVPDNPDAPGAAVSRRARDWWRNEWQGQSFMAIGMQDPVLTPHVMDALRTHVKNCPPAMRVANAGHFVQEHGAEIVDAAFAVWSSP